MMNYELLKDKKFIITGGMGFISSSLAIGLEQLGANVTILGAMIPDYGGNEFNISLLTNKVRQNFCDIRDATAVNFLIRVQDYMSHLAGEVCHSMSPRNSFPDIDMNILIESSHKYNRDAVLVYTCPRGQHGPSTSLPLNEEAPTNPKGISEISNLTAEKIIKPTVSKEEYGETFNVGSNIPTTFLELVKTIIHLAERGSWILLNFHRNAKPKNHESSIRMSQNLRA